MSAVKLIKSRKRDLPTAEYVSVTPELAQTWLDIPGRNRKLNPRTVDKYAAAMRRGDWMVTSQGVAFDEQGKLTDGQHRLHAIVKADVAVIMLVVRDSAGRAQLVLDQGLKRTPHDQIALREGWEVLPIHIAVAKAMITGMGGVGWRQKLEITKDIQLMDRFYSKHRRAVEWVVDLMWGGHQKVQGVCIAPVMAPVARASYTQDKEKCHRFGEVVATGMADRPGESPAVVLRNWLIAGSAKGLSSRGHGDRYIIYKKTEIALNAFLKGESIERLGQRHIETELFPIPNDVVIKLGKAEQEEGE